MDGLQIHPIKFVIGLLVPVLTGIFNLVLEASTFSKNMKTAKVLHRGDDVNILFIDPFLS